MLRVRVELVPDGDDTRVRLLGEVEIANDEMGTELTGHYNVVMTEYDEQILGRKSSFRTTAIIEDVERDIARPMQLASIALSILAPVKRTAASSLGSWGKIIQRGPVEEG